MLFLDISGKAILNGEYKEIRKEKDEYVFLSISSYVKGVLSGQSRKFDRSGILTSIITYENGVEVDRKENVNSSGYLEYIEEEVTQKRHEGKYILYTDEEVRIYEYKNGKLQGLYYVFVVDKNNDKAILTSIENYDEGYLHGIQTSFNSLGKAVLIETYENHNNLATKTTWFEYYQGTTNLRAEKNYTGKILIDGNDISNLSIKERGDIIGYVMQNPNQMISQNLVYDEVAFSLRVKGEKEEHITKKVHDILKVCGLYPYRNWPITSLSYGQKKRVTIASILVTNPKILILDEPTAAQDYTHYLEIMEFVKSINEKLGITIIMITHDMHLMLEYTKRAITLLDGFVISDDSCIKTLSNSDIVKKANLKIPSLYDLAKKIDVDEYSFVYNFIIYERGLKYENIRV